MHCTRTRIKYRCLCENHLLLYVCVLKANDTFDLSFIHPVYYVDAFAFFPPFYVHLFFIQMMYIWMGLWPCSSTSVPITSYTKSTIGNIQRIISIKKIEWEKHSHWSKVWKHQWGINSFRLVVKIYIQEVMLSVHSSRLIRFRQTRRINIDCESLFLNFSMTFFHSVKLTHQTQSVGWNNIERLCCTWLCVNFEEMQSIFLLLSTQ